MISVYLYLMLFLINNLVASRKSVNNSFKYLDGYVPRVVSGWPAKLGDVPYQIAFKQRPRGTRIYSTFCGGSIIAPKKLLSAAHCFTSEENNFFKKICGGGKERKRSLANTMAVAGNLLNRGYHSVVDSPTEGQWRSLERVVFPATYRFPKDDIAIVVNVFTWTFKPFVYNANVGPVPFAQKHIDYRSQCLVSGYGRISRHQTSSKLLLAHLQLLSISKCNRLHRRNVRHLICTSSVFADVGKGDSGGPLVCSGTGDPNEVNSTGVLVGIVSGNWVGKGSFFTRVSHFYNYIMRDSCSQTSFDMALLYLITTIHYYEIFTILNWFYLLHRNYI